MTILRRLLKNTSQLLERRRKTATTTMKYLNRLTPLAVLCLSLLPLSCSTEENLAKKDQERFRGTWLLLYQESEGEKLPNEATAKMFHGRMEFGDKEIHYSAELPGFDFKFAYHLHPQENPKQIDLELTSAPDRQGIGHRSFGIYVFDGDILKLCHNDNIRPIEFKAEKGSGNQLIVLKRGP